MQKRVAIGVVTGLLVLAAIVSTSVSQADNGKGDGVQPKPHEDTPRTPAIAKTLTHGVILGDPMPRPPVGMPPTAIGNEAYDTYSLFLISDPEWAHQNQGELPHLHGAFQTFSQKIGGRHLAVWFTDDNLHGVDISRNQRYCNKFKLPNAKGPYVVIMRKHPDDMTGMDKFVVVYLQNIEATRAMNVLQYLVEDLHSGHAINEPAIELATLVQYFAGAISSHGLGGTIVALLDRSAN